MQTSGQAEDLLQFDNKSYNLDISRTLNIRFGQVQGEVTSINFIVHESFPTQALGCLYEITLY